MTKIAGSGSISQKHGSEDPDPPQNVMDPEHCIWRKPGFLTKGLEHRLNMEVDLQRILGLHVT
jgi:hypothetical protein